METGTDKIDFELSEQGIARLVFKKSESHNAFDDDMIQGLRRVFDDLGARNDVRVLIFEGQGKSFCAGADVKWMARSAEFSPDENMEDARALADMLNKLYHLPQLTIASVQGMALGGGLGIVACCDIVLAERHAIFALPEVKLGLIPATIAPYVMKAIGLRQARRYFQTGEKFTAQRALDLGLVHDLGEDMDEIGDLLDGITNNFLKNGPRAVREAKRLCLDIEGIVIDEELMKETASRLAVIRSGKEAKTGLKAFLNKEKPDFLSRDD